jgi:hypothetical protein
MDPRCPRCNAGLRPGGLCTVCTPPDADDVSLSLDEDDLDPAAVAADPTPPIPSAPAGARRPSRAWAVVATAALMSMFVLVCMGAGTYWAYQRLWNTPERALIALVDAAATADMPEARRRVSSDLWPRGQVMPDPAMLRALAHFEEHESIAWTTRADDKASSVWTQATAVPELSSEAGVWLDKVDGRWLLVRYAAGWGADVEEAAELLREMRNAADARDGVPVACEAGRKDLHRAGLPRDRGHGQQG